MPFGAEPVPGPPAVPQATVRLQFSRDFRFDDATALVGYFRRLGISHIYASPFLRARPGSAHGYDIIDHSQLNPEIGDEASLARLDAALKAEGMGLILDFVPNHMGVGSDNAWWMDVLEWGQRSPYASFFNVLWTPPDPRLQGRVLLPVLGDQYGQTLERGELVLALEGGAFLVRYYDHRFPIFIGSYPRLLRQAAELASVSTPAGASLAGLADRIAARVFEATDVAQQLAAHREAAAFRGELLRLMEEDVAVADAMARFLAASNGTPGEPSSFQPLDELLERQSYRLAFWRVAADEINYRRFFDVNDLAGLRIELPELFELAHQLVFRLLGEGRIHGLRIDHIDGLFDPLAYCEALQRRTAYILAASPPTTRDAAALPHPLYLLVEKILARHESLRPDWPVAGTTGYEFMVLVNGLFVDPAGEQPLTHAYERFIGRKAPYDEMLLDAKRLIIGRTLASELNVLAHALHQLAQQSWRTRDHTLTGLRRALVDIAALLPVYRTYITAQGPTDEDRRYIDWAVAQARAVAQGGTDLSVYDFLHRALTTDLGRDEAEGYCRDDVVHVAMKVQQFTGPVMAKSVEDTLFYRYVRLLSLNEVGGDPNRWGTTPAAFHHVNQERLKRFPHQLVTTATHDHKRGADARVRIDVLSEMPAEWDRRVRRWSRLNRLKRRELEGRPAPGGNDEYLFYQALLGAWPADLSAADRPGLAALAERLAAYLQKAVRESKYRSSWALPDAAYEEAADRFVRQVLDPDRSAAFLADFAAFVDSVAPTGALNGLAQALLTCAAPGVPDLYQGTEFWDFSLVDPDNRRPPDWPARRVALEARAGSDAGDLVRSWRDGRIKQHVIATALALRGASPSLFAAGDYLPLEVSGAEAHRVMAFARHAGDAIAIVVAPRLCAPLLQGVTAPLVPPARWQDTALQLPPASGDLTERMTGRRLSVPASGILALSALLADFPVALCTTAAADDS